MRSASVCMGVSMIWMVGRIWAVDVSKPAEETKPIPLDSTLASPQKDVPSPAEAAKSDADMDAAKSEIAEKIKDPELRKHLLENIDVFGKSEMPAIYILNPSPSVEDFGNSLLTRDFTSDPYFMQNIDREEFEMQTYSLEYQPEAVSVQDKDKDKDGDKDKDKKNATAR